MYGIILSATRAQNLLKQNEPREVNDVIDELLELANDGQLELRALLTNIRADRLMSLGLTAALSRLAADLRTRSGLDIRLSLAAEPEMPVATKEALVSITREALRNIAKHASADSVDIVLEVSAIELVLLIIDDGLGFYPAKRRPGHFGLQCMRERAMAVGGTLDLISADTVGTQVSVRVPRSYGA